MCCLNTSLPAHAVALKFPVLPRVRKSYLCIEWSYGASADVWAPGGPDKSTCGHQWSEGTQSSIFDRTSGSSAFIPSAEGETEAQESRWLSSWVKRDGRKGLYLVLKTGSLRPGWDWVTPGELEL